MSYFISSIKVAGDRISSVCIYVKNMHEVLRLILTIREIFMKRSLKIFCFCLNNHVARDSNRVASSILSKPLITRLVVSVDAGRPYLFVRKQNFLKNISYLKTLHIFVCNKINWLSFTIN